MASKEELKQIAMKCVEDESFREQMDKDPASAAASMGITLTAEQVADIKAHAAKAEEVGLRESKGFVSTLITST